MCLPAGMCMMGSWRPRCSCSLTATSSAWQVGGHLSGAACVFQGVPFNCEPMYRAHHTLCRTMPHCGPTHYLCRCCCCNCISICAVGDIYPEGVQLKKGDYVIRAILRHDDAGLLDKLKVRRRRFTLRFLWRARVGISDGRTPVCLAGLTSASCPLPPCCRPCQWSWSASWTPPCRWAHLPSCLRAHPHGLYELVYSYCRSELPVCRPSCRCQYTTPTQTASRAAAP